MARENDRGTKVKKDIKAHHLTGFLHIFRVALFGGMQNLANQRWAQALKTTLGSHQAEKPDSNNRFKALCLAAASKTS